MTIKAIIFNVCDSFLKPKFLLEMCIDTAPQVQGGIAAYLAHLLEDSKPGF